MEQVLLQVGALISGWSHDFSSCPATHQLSGRGVVLLPCSASVCFSSCLDFPFPRSGGCVFARVSGAQEWADLRRIYSW